MNYNSNNSEYISLNMHLLYQISARVQHHTIQFHLPRAALNDKSEKESKENLINCETNFVDNSEVVPDDSNEGEYSTRSLMLDTSCGFTPPNVVTLHGEKSCIYNLNLMEYKSYNVEIVKYLINSKRRMEVIPESQVIIFSNLENQILCIGDTHHSSIKTAFKDLDKIIDSFNVENRKKSLEFIQCLKSLSPSVIESALRDCDVTAGWGLRYDSIFVCSSSSEDTRTAFAAIESLVIAFQYPCGYAKIHLLDELLLVEFCRQLQNSFTGLEFRYEECKRKVCIAIPSSLNKELVITRLNGLSSLGAISNIMTSEVDMSTLDIDLLQRNKDVFSRCIPKEDQESSEIDVDFNRESGCCTMKSKSLELLNKVTENLENLVKEKLYDEVKPVELGFLAWCKSTSCMKKLQDIDRLCGTCTTVSMSLVSSNMSLMDVDHNDSLGWIYENRSNMYRYLPVLNKVELVRDCLKTQQGDGLFTCPGVVSSNIDLSRSIHTKLTNGLQNVQFNGQNMKVFHSPLREKDSNEDPTKHLQNKIKVALRTMHNLKTIIIAVVGTKKMGYPLTEIAEMILGSTLSFLSDSPCCLIQTVKIAVPARDKKVFQALNMVIQKIKSIVQQPQDVSGSLVIRFTGFDWDSIHHAVVRFKQEAQHVIMRVDWSNSSLRSAINGLSARQVAMIKQKSIERNLDVEISTSNSQIKLEGLRADVEILRDMINSMLLSFTPVNLELPAHWTPGLDFHEVILKPNTEEYQRVYTQATENKSMRLEWISEIVRVQNRELYIQYEAHKSRVTRECMTVGFTGEAMERLLWHGTSRNSVKSICAQEFNRSYAGTANGMSYGQGCYFATSPSYAHSMARKAELVGGCLMMCKVVTGRYCAGNACLTSKEVGENQCHSTVNNMVAPSMFVVYHDAAAYPEYVLKFN